jgi:hypothetical protein
MKTQLGKDKMDPIETDPMADAIADVVDTLRDVIKENPEQARAVVALVALQGATASQGKEGANAVVDLAFSVADAFLARVTPGE